MCFVKFFLNSFFLFFIDYVIKRVIIFREYHIDNRTEPFTCKISSYSAAVWNSSRCMSLLTPFSSSNEK